MTSSTKFSFYDPAVAETPQESPSTDADASSACVDATVGSSHDETDAIDERDDGTDATATATATAAEEPHTKNTRGPSVEEWLEKVNNLNSIRKMLKEEVEQDGGEYILFWSVHMHRHLYHTNNNLLRRTSITNNSHVC